MYKNLRYQRASETPKDPTNDFFGNVRHQIFKIENRNLFHGLPKLSRPTGGQRQL